jgi:DNA repair exonuclease SbcCD nuclease subunit
MADTRPLRVIHTSDVHLGAYSLARDNAWSERRALMEAAFARVIDAGNEIEADALLIAGDFFDNDRVTEETVVFAAEQIARFRGEAFLLPGNHDPMDPGRIYWRHDMEAIAPNLRIFREHGGEVFEAHHCDLVVWGRGYLETDWHFEPLVGLPERADGRWHIAMAHGHYVRSDEDLRRSMLIHDHHLDAAGDWDYVALGHWEPHADISREGVTAIYSGAPLALTDANEKAGWAVVADFAEGGVSWRLHRVDPREAAG